MTEATGTRWLIAALPDAQLTTDQPEPVWINVTLDGRFARRVPAGIPPPRSTLLASKCLHQPVVNSEQNILKPC